MTNIVIPFVWLLSVGVLLAASNPTIQAHLDEIYSAFPDASDPVYDTWYGTNAFAFTWDFLTELGTKAYAAFALIGAVTVWPTFEIYGQVASPTEFPWMAAVQIVPLGWLGFAAWERLPMLGGG